MNRQSHQRSGGFAFWCLKMNRLDVAIAAIPNHLEAFHKFFNATVEGIFWLEPSGLKLGVGHNIVTLVRVLADLCFDEVEPRHMLLNVFTQFLFRNIRRRQANVINLAFHTVKIGDPVQKHTGHIAHMNVIALEVALEQNHSLVAHSTMHEVIDQKVEAQAR